ncbi:SET domain-containing protein [Sarocladium strictum]
MSLLFAESSFCGPVNDSSSHTGASDSHGSTPPTTVSDAASLHSDTSKHDAAMIDPEPLESITVSLPEPFTTLSTEDDATVRTRSLLIATASLTDTATPSAESTPGRGRRARVSAPVYNLARLSGTASHGKRRANGDVVDSKSSLRRQSLANQSANGSPMSTRQTRPSNKVVREGIDALDLQWSLSKLESPRARRNTQTAPQPTRLTTRRSASEAVAAISNKVSAIGKRIRKPSEKALENVPRELRKLQDTKEFSHIDDKPVRYTVWSNGKYVDPNAPAEPPAKKVKTVEPLAEDAEKADAASEPITHMRKRRPKKYLDKGLYAGQEKPLDPVKCLLPAEKKKWALLPELHSTGRINTVMPAPVFNGLRLLVHGRDFKLPYNVCHPSPPGQPKPDEWKKMTRNRFIGDSKDYWRKFPMLDDSKCVCTADDGCGEDCQNRIMLYECDDNNCNVGKELCNNRAFADLMARRSKGGKYRVGVEVVKTSDRGYGVRSNRNFHANQIIMEYSGEIITEKECERRMNNEYKHNECYYLMSFDQNMIIDATTGSIARFVNHSCNPNCRMIKWIVGGQPRMALFAGDRPINTGDELTYDYNFDPFSAKNVQTCLCGEPNCRGILGPKPRPKPKQASEIKKAVKATVKAGKRKLKELTGNEDAGAKKASPKRRKVDAVKGVKTSISSASVKIKGAATSLKKSVSVKVSKQKPTAVSKASPAKGGKGTPAKIIKKTTTKRVVTAFKNTPTKKQQTSAKTGTKTTIVVKSPGSSLAKKQTGAAATAKKQSATKTGTPKAKKASPGKVQKKTASAGTPKSVGSPRSTKKTPRKIIGKIASPRKAIDLAREKSSIRVVTSSAYDDYEN